MEWARLLRSNFVTFDIFIEETEDRVWQILNNPSFYSVGDDCIMYVFSSFKIGEPNLLKKIKLPIWLAYNKTQSE